MNENRKLSVTGKLTRISLCSLVICCVLALITTILQVKGIAFLAAFFGFSAVIVLLVCLLTGIFAIVNYVDA